LRPARARAVPRPLMGSNSGEEGVAERVRSPATGSVELLDHRGRER
jgi:hypothetical protein